MRDGNAAGDADRGHEYAVVCETCGKDVSYRKDFGTASAVCDTHRKANPGHDAELIRRGVTGDA